MIHTAERNDDLSGKIIIDRKDLFDLVEYIAKSSSDKAISETLKAVGLKGKDIDPWISQNAAVKMLKQSGRRIGLPSLRKAMFDKTVRWEKKDYANPRGRVRVKEKDVLRLINQ